MFIMANLLIALAQVLDYILWGLLVDPFGPSCDFMG